jgi:hypothetical protein
MMYAKGNGKVEVHSFGEGYGTSYLGEDGDNIFQKLANVAEKVGIVSRELSDVAKGDKKIATVPTDRASITFPLPGKPVGISVPLVPLIGGLGVLAYLAFNHNAPKRRRR